MKKKIEYKLLVNYDDTQKEHEFKYSYGSTKDANIFIAHDGFCIRINTGATITSSDIIDSKSSIFLDAIKKSFLLFYIIHDCSLSIKNIIFDVGGIQNIINDTDFPIIGICNENYKYSFPMQWKSKVVFDFILTQKNKYRKLKNGIDDCYEKNRKRLLASASALILAKTKATQTERFIYLWMAFNGLYGFISSQIEPSGKKPGTPQRIGEIDEICMFGQMSGLLTKGDKWKIRNQDKGIIAEKVMKELNKLSSDTSRRSYSCVIDSSFEKKIEALLHTYNSDKSEQYDISCKAYLHLFLPYYLRCKYFHAEFPIKLVSQKQDYMINTLSIVNDFLEEELCVELPKWMDVSLVNREMKPKFGGIKYGSSF